MTDLLTLAKRLAIVNNKLARKEAKHEESVAELKKEREEIEKQMRDNLTK